jgi:hypothetical protein
MLIDLPTVCNLCYGDFFIECKMSWGYADIFLAHLMVRTDEPLIGARHVTLDAEINHENTCTLRKQCCLLSQQLQEVKCLKF